MLYTVVVVTREPTVVVAGWPRLLHLHVAQIGQAVLIRLTSGQIGQDATDTDATRAGRADPGTGPGTAAAAYPGRRGPAGPSRAEPSSGGTARLHHFSAVVDGSHLHRDLDGVVGEEPVVPRGVRLWRGGGRDDLRGRDGVPVDRREVPLGHDGDAALMQLTARTTLTCD